MNRFQTIRYTSDSNELTCMLDKVLGIIKIFYNGKLIEKIELTPDDDPITQLTNVFVTKIETSKI